MTMRAGCNIQACVMHRVLSIVLVYRQRESNDDYGGRVLHSKATAVSATANGNRLPTLPGLIDLSSYMSNQKSLHKQTDVDGSRMLHTSGPVGFLFLRVSDCYRRFCLQL